MLDIKITKTTTPKAKPTDESNYCLNCHDWPRSEQAYIEYMDL